jgi:hypothetical protein
VVALLAAFGLFLWRRHELIAWSEPSAGFHFGRHFPELFGAAPLAYGLPLLVHGAVALVGPVWAYLVNLPVLVLCAGLLYAFARALVPRDRAGQAWLAPAAGAVAVGLLVWTGGERLIEWVSPYPDPLSHAFALLSCLCVLRHRSAPRQPLWMLAAGAALALACSVREVSGLLLLPFLTLGLASRRELPLRRAAALFAAGLALASIPMLVHNHGVSGRFWVPAQAAARSVADGPITATTRAELLEKGLPRALGHLTSGLGWPALLLAGVALAEAALRRRREMPWLVVPAAAVFLVFHGARSPARSLFAVDLFVLPAAGVGAAVLLHGLLRPLGVGRLGRVAATGAVAAALAGAIGVSLDASRAEAEGFRIADARALTHHVEALVPGERPLLGEGRIGEILRCFVSHSERVLLLRAPRVFAEPALRQRIREVVGGAEEAYLVSLAEPLAHFLRSESDLELLASFPASAYGLADGDGFAADARFHVDRVTAWQRLEASRALAAVEPGRHLLAVDVGHLSSRPRSGARLHWNEELLDDAPRDGVNYYAVRVDEGLRESRVWLRSDAPVPSRIEASLRPLTQPVEMRFDAEEAMDEPGRLSASFFADPDSRYPTLRGEGSVRLPTPEPAGAVFVAVADVGLRRGQEKGRHELTVGTEAGPFYRLRFRGQEGVAKTGAFWHRVSFALHEPLVRGDETLLLWRYRGPELAGEPPGLSLRSLRVYRHPLGSALEIDVGSDGDEPFLLDGFGLPESLPGSARHTLRATGARAELRIPLLPDPRPALLRVHYLTGLRPASAPPPAPEFVWNGVPVQGGSQEEPLGRFTRVTARLPLPAPLLTPRVHQLVIRSTPWEGRGILLEGVSVERAPGAQGVEE